MFNCRVHFPTNNLVAMFIPHLCTWWTYLIIKCVRFYLSRMFALPSIIKELFSELHIIANNNRKLNYV
jgi:putative exporter of polyketide antibiotics